MSSTSLDVLIIEDEADLRDAMEGFFAQIGYRCVGVASAEQADTWLETHTANVFLVDLNLPGEAGLDWLKRHTELRERGIIIVSAAGSDSERIAGRSSGADAYFIKPINLVELGVTVKNLLDRLGLGGSWQLDSLKWMLTSPSGQGVKLTASELTLLESLACKPGAVVERDQIIRRLGETPEAYDIRRMEVLVRRLRMKVEDELGDSPPISTIRGVGYAFTAPLSWVPE